MSTVSDHPPQEISRHRLVLLSILVAIGCGGMLLATSGELPMTWDEGNAIRRAEGIQHWAERWVTLGDEPGEPGPLTCVAIDEDWHYTTRIEGHPAFYGIVIAIGRGLSAPFLSPLNSWRLGPMLLFGLAAGAMFYRMAREYSPAAGLAAAAALMLLPRMFAHAHTASFDGPLVACWILAWATFSPARENWRMRIVWGIALGLTLSAKATGWIAPLPFIAWTLIYLDRRAAKALAVGIPVALLTFWIVNPPLWHEPVRSWATFFSLNLDRSQFNISTQFLGRMYNLDHPLPWYNTLVWTGLTVPVGILFLAGVGLIRVLRRCRREPLGTLLVANWLVLMIVRALPGTPPHDGVRLFLPSFAFLAALAGVGAVGLAGATAGESSSAEQDVPENTAGQASSGTRRYRVTAVVVLCIYLTAAGNLRWYAPQWLSYYNLAIGGLPGATALGMEPTYYWDGLDETVLDWLRQHAGPGEKVRFGAASTENLALMREWGVLPVEYRSRAPGEYRWYVLQRRPSGLQPADLWLIENKRPVFAKTIRSGGWGPWRLDVPLVEVYPYADFVEAREATERPG
jgi:dolichyl-phosphate-mannose-protein mannosyltransferase